MSRLDEYDDFDDLDGDSGSNALREVRKAQRAAEKRAKELEAELAKYRAEARQANIKSLLAEKGLNPKIAAFMPESVTEAEKINEWLDEYGDVFAPAAPQGEPDPQAQQQDPVVDTFGQVANGGTPPQGGMENLAARIAAAKTREELNEILHGNPYGPSF